MANSSICNLLDGSLVKVFRESVPVGNSCPDANGSQHDVEGPENNSLPQRS